MYKGPFFAERHATAKSECEAYHFGYESLECQVPAMKAKRKRERNARERERSTIEERKEKKCDQVVSVNVHSI